MQPAQEIPKSSIFYMDQAKTRSALLCKTNISGEAAKKCDKCRQMQYIGKDSKVEDYLSTVVYIVMVWRNAPLRNSALFLCNIWHSKLVSAQLLLCYRNVPKFSDRQVWANSADPDQTAPRGVPPASFGCITLRKSHLVQLLGWSQQISGCLKI